MRSIFEKLASQPPERLFWIVATSITLIRLLTLPFSQINLGPDEAQYWWWSREIDFGYFSKPPMIAWLIGFTTALFGNEEWAIRLSSPIITYGTSIMLFAISRHLYNAQAALWAGLVWITLPIIALSGIIISTDIPLLFFWSFSLYAFVRLCDSTPGQSRLFWTLMLGLGLGLGMLSKYAMIYFPLGMGLAFLLSSHARQALHPWRLLGVLVIAGLVFTPNILWNAAHNFQTLTHTRANASWNGSLLNPSELLEFLLTQFGVIGPILFGFFIWSLFHLSTRRAQSKGNFDKDLLLLAFALPPLLIISLQAFISRANANWAMAAYPAVIILVTVWLLRVERTGWLKASTLFHISLATVATIATLNLSLVDALGLSNGVKRVRNWDKQAAEIATYAEDYSAIVVDDRELMGNILYYMRQTGKPVYAWDVNRHVDNHYEAFFAYPKGREKPALLISKYPEYLYSYVEFPNIIELGESIQEMNVRCPRKYSLYEVSGYDNTKGPRDIPSPPSPIVHRNGRCKPY